MRWSLKSILNTSRSSLLEPGDERFLDGVRAAQVTEATRIAREIEGVTDVVTTNLVTTQ